MMTFVDPDEADILFKKTSPGVKPGTLVLQVTANDVDLYPVLVYQLSSVGGIGCSSQSAFTIDRYSGKIWTDQRLDYESCASYQLTIQVS